jgi:putative heme-binding domain-containing protein
MTMDDPWFRGLDLLGGPDGGVFVSDWSDIGECHDQEGIHRTSGRIYRITFGEPKGAPVGDLAKLSDADLVKLQLHRNEWFVRQARQVLQERAARGSAMTSAHAALREMFDKQADDTRKLRAMWCLHVTGGARPEWLQRQLGHANEHVRVWAIQLLLEQRPPSQDLCNEFARMARSDNSGLVLSFLASAMQRMPLAERWPVAESLAAPAIFAGDPTLPLLIWYGIEPAVPMARERASALAEASGLPKLRRMLARRLTEDLDTEPLPVNRLVGMLDSHGADSAFQSDILTGMSEALRGWRKASPPEAWAVTATQLAKSPNDNVRKLVRELAVVFGDGRATDELRVILGNAGGDVSIRRRALQALVQNRAPNLVPLLQGLLQEMEIAPDAVRGLAALGDPGTSRILLNNYAGLRTSSAKTEAINALASRPAFAGALFEAVRSGAIRRKDVGPLQVRQMRSFHDPEIDRQLTELWPDLRPMSAEKEQQVARYKKLLTPDRLAGADPAQGRQIFSQICATCHVLFGEGGPMGPDLTGSDRRNLDYLLDNILDPSGVVPESYHVSIINLKDGRVINGVVGVKTDRTLAVQTPTEKLTLERVEIESITESQLSMMPEGLFEALKEEDVRALITYLMAPTQVPLKARR